eukprot:TRINITY_DN8961_c0_g1_i1.p1 TRINITY_DN8961_c0_g1~~TRINITY_DN8961_c0_g1_i1.p1  ORF type:complete len:292 (-),score=104.80 TRINITY_DN8961_c0_g1_i1:129-1004(-)
MGKKKKGVPDDASPEEQVQHYIELSRDLHAKGSLGSAVFQAEEGLKLARSLLGYQCPKTGHAMINLAFLFIHQNKAGKAKGLLEQARDLADGLGDSALSARAMELLAECALQDKAGVRKTVKYKNAQQLLRMAEESRERQSRVGSRPKVEKQQREEQQHEHEQTPRKRVRVEEHGTPAPLVVEEDKSVPVDLSCYATVDATSDWLRHQKRFEWLYHTESQVFYNTETTDYYRMENGQPTLVQKEVQEEEEPAQQVTVPEETPAEEPEEERVRRTGTVKYFVQAKGLSLIHI